MCPDAYRSYQAYSPPLTPSPPPIPRSQGSAFYLGGAALVVIGWTMVGLVLEAYGFWLLFCEFIPTVLSYSRRVPIVGKALEVPWLRTVRGERG